MLWSFPIGHGVLEPCGMVSIIYGDRRVISFPEITSSISVSVANTGRSDGFDSRCIMAARL